MSAIEELQRDCAYCRQPATLKWKHGPMRSEGVRLVVDQVFHDECWDKFFAIYNGKRKLAPLRRSLDGGQVGVTRERNQAGAGLLA